PRQPHGPRRAPILLQVGLGNELVAEHPAGRRWRGTATAHVSRPKPRIRTCCPRFGWREGPDGPPAPVAYLLPPQVLRLPPATVAPDLCQPRPSLYSTNRRKLPLGSYRAKASAAHAGGFPLQPI